MPAWLVPRSTSPPLLTPDLPLVPANPWGAAPAMIIEQYIRNQFPVSLDGADKSVMENLEYQVGGWVSGWEGWSWRVLKWEPGGWAMLLSCGSKDRGQQLPVLAVCCA